MRNISRQKIAIGYIRVNNTPKRENNKIAEVQKKQIEVYCKNKGLLLEATVVDRHEPNCKCTNEGMVGLIYHLLGECRFASCFVCVDINSLLHNNVDFCQIEAVFKKADVELLFIKNPKLSKQARLN